MMLLISIWNIIKVILVLIFVVCILFIVWHRIYSSLRRRKQQRQQQRNNNNKKNHKVIAFFHPYCTGGGGGERVLWKMIQVLGTMIENNNNNNNNTNNDNNEKPKNTNMYYNNTIIIYTIDPPSPTYIQDVKKQVQLRFGLIISQQIQLQFIHLYQYNYLLKPIPYISLLFESLGVMILAYIGLYTSLFYNNNNTSHQQYQTEKLLLPDIFIDTTGCAFTYIPASILFNCQIIAYVHYPTISTDMLQLVYNANRSNTTAPTSTYNHQSYISKSIITTYMKLIYYILFAILYGCIGSLSTIVIVNSTWTYNHIYYLWKYSAYTNRIRIIYPPCSLPEPISNNTSKETTSTLTTTNSVQQQQQQQRQTIILSIGQFRPEKDHTLQIKAMAQYLNQYYYPTQKSTNNKNNTSNKNDTTNNIPLLVLIGSCRNVADEQRLQSLQLLVKTLNINQHVQFVINQPFSIVQEYLYKSYIGIHTMWNEHFGIGIVEMMAAGLVVIAHNSGGPKSDIVVPIQKNNTTINKDSTILTTGFLASSVDEYAERIHYILSLDPNEITVIRNNAIESAKRFTDDVFAHSFENVMLNLKFK